MSLRGALVAALLSCLASFVAPPRAHAARAAVVVSWEGADVADIEARLASFLGAAEYEVLRADAVRAARALGGVEDPIDGAAADRLRTLLDAQLLVVVSVRPAEDGSVFVGLTAHHGGSPFHEFAQGSVAEVGGIADRLLVVLVLRVRSAAAGPVASAGTTEGAPPPQAPRAPEATPPAARSTASWTSVRPSAGSGHLDAERPGRRERGEGGGGHGWLGLGGVALFVVSYAVTIAVVAGQCSSSSCRDDTEGLAAIPLAGGFVWSLNNPTLQLGLQLSLSTISTVLQVGGLVMVIVAAAIEGHRSARRRRAGLEIGVGAQADGGLVELRGRF